MSKKHILVLGSGSVGKRHAQNLHNLGCNISCMDPREDRLKEIEQSIPVISTFRNTEEAFLQAHVFDGVAVTSPPSFHVEQCMQALEKKLPILLEKPVSNDFDSAKLLEHKVVQSKVPLLLGYTYRWWEPLEEVKKLLSNNVVGKLLHVKFVMSAHLADWHPWENYQDFFMASKELGGGALLDESHWLDLMLWFFGMPDTMFAQVEKLSDLDIDTDDNVDMLLHYKDGLKVLMHLDIFGRPHEKYIRFVGEEGTLLWTMDPNRISIGKGYEDKWEVYDYQCERNDMFLKVDEEFLDILDGGIVRTCSINDGVKAMMLIDAARYSSQSQSVVSIV